jgi:hypothetical protein
MALAGHLIARFPGAALRKATRRHTLAAVAPTSAAATLPRILATIGRAG